MDGEKPLYAPFIYFIQAVLYLPYFWYSFTSLMSSVSLSEFHGSPEPEGTPLSFLVYNIPRMIIIISIIALLLLITKGIGIQTRPLLIVNIVLPCLTMILRFFLSSFWLLAFSSDYKYAKYVGANEITFFVLNILLATLSVYFLKRLKRNNRSV